MSEEKEPKTTKLDWRRSASGEYGQKANNLFAIDGKDSGNNADDDAKPQIPSYLRDKIKDPYAG